MSDDPRCAAGLDRLVRLVEVHGGDAARVRSETRVGVKGRFWITPCGTKRYRGWKQVAHTHFGWKDVSPLPHLDHRCTTAECERVFRTHVAALGGNALGWHHEPDYFTWEIGGVLYQTITEAARYFCTSAEANSPVPRASAAMDGASLNEFVRNAWRGPTGEIRVGMVGYIDHNNNFEAEQDDSAPLIAMHKLIDRTAAAHAPVRFVTVDADGNVIVDRVHPETPAPDRCRRVRNAMMDLWKRKCCADITQTLVALIRDVHHSAEDQRLLRHAHVAVCDLISRAETPPSERWNFGPPGV